MPMSAADRTIGAGRKPVATAIDRHLLCEAFRPFWTVADGYVKSRLLLAFLLVSSVSLLMSLTPLALKLAMDALTLRDAHAALIVSYVLSQYVVRAFTELRVLTHGQAGQRMHRHITQQLFEHVIRLPLRLHLDRRAGAVGKRQNRECAAMSCSWSTPSIPSCRCASSF
jgi:ABC-type bacteriocin/lantibiotic exporter with double-glycine peptidase domain